MSGSTASTSTVGLGGGVPRMRSSTQAPRRIGEVVVPLAVTFMTPAIVSTPPRWLSGRQRHLAELRALHARDAVVLCQPPVEHVKSEETKFVRLRSFFSTSSKNRCASLTIADLEHVVVLRIERRSGSVASMLRRPSHWPAKFSVNAVALGSSSIRSTCSRSVSGWLQLALLGECEQLLVGHRAPQEVRQPAGQGEVIEAAAAVARRADSPRDESLAEEQEMRRHQHRLEADAHRLLERVPCVQLGLHAGRETA